MQDHDGTRSYSFDVTSLSTDDLQFGGQLDGTVASKKHRHSESDTWSSRDFSRLADEPGLPASPFPSEIDDPAEYSKVDVGSKLLGDIGETHRFLRRHTLPSLADDAAQRPRPALAARCPAQTYTALTLSTPDAVFATGDNGPLSPGRLSTQSTIVCGENNWKTQVDWETTSITSGSSSESASTLDSQVGLISGDVQRDLGRHTRPNRAQSFHARHHSAGDFAPGFRQAAHRERPGPRTAGRNPSFKAAAAREVKSSPETPFISTAALWEPGDSFSPAAHVERRATINHSEGLAKLRPRGPLEKARSISIPTPYPARQAEDKGLARRDAAKSLHKWDTARVIQERTVDPPKPDRAAIYEAMTGSTLVQRRTSLPCTEDHRPHICLHELSDESD